MTRRRWIADEVDGNRAALVGEHAAHLSRVLRVRVGQEFDVVAEGFVRHARVSAVADHRVDFELGEHLPAHLAADLTVFISIFKFDRMEWAIEKITELGVARIVPVVARRTEHHLAAAAVKRVERWRRIAAQASEQARRSVVPEIADSIPLESAILSSASIKIVLSELEQENTLRAVVPDGAASSAIALAFGPEGGWSEDELAVFHKHDWTSASLGDTILRAETAVIAAVAIVLCLI
ncbi:MAG TPA: RsmE family RNA methyltransferase [Terriglobales bacterium]|jgi:16S rRNA (uracil1498-N3)-methyltransferase